MTAGRNTDHVYHREWRKEHPIALRGEGVYVVNVGHGLQDVADAMAEQARRIAFPYAGSFTTEAELDLAEAVIELAPPGLQKVFFVSGVVEARMDGVRRAAPLDAGP